MYSSNAILSFISIYKQNERNERYLSLGLDYDFLDQHFILLEIQVVNMAKGHAGGMVNVAGIVWII